MAGSNAPELESTQVTERVEWSTPLPDQVSQAPRDQDRGITLTLFPGDGHSSQAG